MPVLALLRGTHLAVPFPVATVGAARDSKDRRYRQCVGLQQRALGGEPGAGLREYRLNEQAAERRSTSIEQIYKIRILLRVS